MSFQRRGNRHGTCKSDIEDYLQSPRDVRGPRIHAALRPNQRTSIASEGSLMAASVRNNKDRSRFELDVESEIAFANYRLTPSAVIITHTETPRALRGRGIASELVKGALELIRADGRKVIAGCGFVVDYLRRNPQFADLTA